ncbi:MAG: CD225/dispanin family protein [Alistipes sp.]|nr:CD225/dispanin family protein [Alistipes sp.]
MTPTQKPNDHLVLAILTTLCCCMPLGIVSIIRSTQVNSYWAAEKYDEAMQASADAKKWALIGMGAMVIGVLCYLLFFGGLVALGVGLSEMDF